MTTTQQQQQQPQPPPRRSELVLRCVQERGVIYQRVVQESEYGAEISTRLVDQDGTPLTLTSRWTIPPDEMEKLTAWWQAPAESEAAP